MIKSYGYDVRRILTNIVNLSSATISGVPK